MQRILSFEQTPPLSVPLRFFLTAPLFAMAAAMLLLWLGPQALLSRWSPITLALTHLLTLGFLAMSMIGALLQILPVVAGIDIPYSRLTAGAAHALLTLGTAMLAAGFAWSSSTLFKFALPLLLLAFGWIFIAGLRGVWRAPHTSPMLAAIRLALAALAIAVGLGSLAASAFTWQVALPLKQITGLHAAWGLLGWVGLLVIGVAYQVVPMFQVTPIYPRRITQWLAKTIFLTLACWATAFIAAPGWLESLFSTLAALAFALFSGITLYLLSQRKRPKPDATTMFWRTALISLLCCTVLWASGGMFPQLADAAAYPLTLGILFIVGFAYSVINGMLYKIVPFLVWYHLQNQLAGGCAKAPNVKQILPDRTAEMQFRAHLLALVLLTAAAIWPQWFSQPGALAFAVSSGWLWLNLVKAARVYRSMTANPEAMRPA
jgi:hypothetical protein